MGRTCHEFKVMVKNEADGEILLDLPSLSNKVNRVVDFLDRWGFDAKHPILQKDLSCKIVTVEAFPEELFEILYRSSGVREWEISMVFDEDYCREKL